MARKKTATVRVNVKAQISGRLRAIRQELFGEHGGPELARRLNLPARTWYNYETGVTVPAEVLLSFIDQTGTNPVWLLSGEGAKFTRGPEEFALDDMTPQQLIRRGLEKLEESSSGAAENRVQDCLSLDLVPLSALCQYRHGTVDSEDQVLADQQWIPHPSETVAARLEDEAMTPVLPAGSVVAIDFSVRDPAFLTGRLAVICISGVAIVRWLELTGRHIVLRPNQISRAYPMIPLELGGEAQESILGQVVWSWSQFGE
ncbi:MAG: hypothetical protein JWN86_3731 [Planctomycetota bacterium]|nr:hypothetical protein [Planctomycetota bacterium]